MYAINLISLPVHNACFPSFQNTRGSPDSAHLVINYCSPLVALLSCNNFIHVSRKVVSMEGSIYGSGWSLLPKVEASLKLFLASINFSFVRSKSNSGSFARALQTHVSSLDHFIFIFLCGRATYEHHVHIGVLFTRFKPHNLDILSGRMLEYPFLTHLCDQYRTIH